MSYFCASTTRVPHALVASKSRKVLAQVAASDRQVNDRTVNPNLSGGLRVDEVRADRETARDNAVSEFSDVSALLSDVRALGNGDEELFENRDFRGRDKPLVGFASFTKALKHDMSGIPEPEAFESLIKAVETGLTSTDPDVNKDAFERVLLGGGQKRLVNPMAAFSTQLIGNDNHGARMAPAPTFGSKNTAVDMVERYWMALCRDVPFDQYATNEDILAACRDLNHVGFEEEFGFRVTPQTVFRGGYDGCDVGPHVSQFLLNDFNFGNQTISQVMNFPQENLDYMTDMPGWFAVNNGDADLSGTDVLNVKRRMTTMRDAGQWVHIDLPLQSGLYSTLILNSLLGKGVEITEASPYGAGRAVSTSDPFTTLGIPDISGQSSLAAGYALKHAWFQKWAVHRRLRPEVFAQRLELFRSGEVGRGGDPFNDGDFKRIFRDGLEVFKETTVLERIFAHNKLQNEANGRKAGGTWLLPMGYPEGSPTHPAYPGGHSCFVAAAVTVAKAFYKDTAFPDPVMVDPSNPTGSLIPYTGETLTVHGELNKLIANVTHFRDGAGMHWRSDGQATTRPVTIDGRKLYTGGNLIGESMAVSMLRDVKHTYREPIGTFSFNSVGGKRIEV